MAVVYSNYVFTLIALFINDYHIGFSYELYSTLAEI
jgi:hypothetical protein